MFYIPFLLVKHTSVLQTMLKEGPRNTTSQKAQDLHFDIAPGHLLIRIEQYNTKQHATIREKFLKTGKGRDEIKQYISQYIDSSGAVSAAAEKD